MGKKKRNLHSCDAQTSIKALIYIMAARDHAVAARSWPHVIMRFPRFIILSSLLVCYLPELSGSAGSDTLHGGDAHELFPRVPLVKWAHITTSWDEEDAPFNSRSEGYHEIVEIISDVSEIVAVPERLNDVKQMLRSVGRCLTSHGVNYAQSIAFPLSEYAIVY